MSLLEVEDLTVNFYTEEGVVTAVDDLSFRIDRGEKFGVVGESGAGKSVTALSVMRLIEEPGRIESGTIRFDGQDLMELSDSAVRDVRGNDIAMIFQDAQTALNPVYTVGEQISEAIRHHLDYSDAEARDRTIRLLDDVGIPEPEARYDDYPHEFSGGMQQRAIIAMALSCDPELLIADEPTTALDVTIEAKILDRLDRLADEYDTAIQLITHDLGVIAEMCDRVMVMYAGRAVENAPVEELYYDPKHPYTVGLMSAIPRIGDRQDRLQTIPGTMPDLVEVPSGCSFHPRCPFAEEACTRKQPPLVDPETGDGVGLSDRSAACLAYTGDLDSELDYEVEVKGGRGSPPDDTQPDPRGGRTDTEPLQADSDPVGLDTDLLDRDGPDDSGGQQDG
ncbi:ABC transporter ATP-binding protein [Haloarcula hispanica N601]|uniref:ABC transporter ATP-binding protein n=4 Tax=Haloarcula TaxID=2237 RepID=V5TQJ2_HALHI|nr:MULTISPECIES: ABC transporter ATP-binding protein [Haloarcula]AEM58124.1 oligopeptide ABC transporter ATPase component [Haloarcula hispanica ATCC 33960]AHB66864.1 ABC transporter ATP-binding protein [Haloarcula hispanica N601]AJF25163.1 ABC transporter ATP-binding protein [Haloarcula sp. CBA1115]EMA24097.1 oligopeptide ABC transporter ATPase [Haloarcula amylolytica JCM 13557]KAA9406216.1 ABC transporter ATP-binding protein [Haloarcula sp. CBA1131]